MLKKMFEYGAKNLEINKQKADDLNVFPVPDGYTGTNMSLTFTHAAGEVKKLGVASIETITKTASSAALIGARGNSGVILSQLLRGLAQGCKGIETLDIKGVAHAVKSSADAAYKAVMKPTEGTILTVAREMSEFAMQSYETYTDLEKFMKDLVQSGRDALAKTPEMLPVLKEAGVVDSGGFGLMCIVEGAYLGFTNQELGQEVELQLGHGDRLVDDSNMRPEDITFGYCTEFIIKDAEGADDDELREYLNTIGDCVLVIKDDDIVKVHVHTDHPGRAFEKGLTYGQLIRMKVDNMREMVGEVKQDEEVSTERVPYGFVSISPGGGLSDLMEDLGVTRIISGGQTMNPSTHDFLEEIKVINADHIFLFPNNSNIIMAANQAKVIMEKEDVGKTVHVIPTKTIPQCISAMLAFNADEDWETNENTMLEIIQTVKTGEVTFAVRDTKIKNLKIKKGDVIGIYNKEILFCGNDVKQVTMDLINHIANDESELISVYYGEDVTEADAQVLVDSIQDQFEDCDVEMNRGGQPLYYYIISVE